MRWDFETAKFALFASYFDEYHDITIEHVQKY